MRGGARKRAEIEEERGRKIQLIADACLELYLETGEPSTADALSRRAGVSIYAARQYVELCADLVFTRIYRPNTSRDYPGAEVPGGHWVGAWEPSRELLRRTILRLRDSSSPAGGR